MYKNKALNLKAYNKIRRATDIVRLKVEAFLMLLDN